jgi:predicted  nucleic acid-binding Zn-ribbon protein
MTRWGMNNHTDEDRILELEEQVSTLEEQKQNLYDQITILESKLENINRIINY